MRLALDEMYSPEIARLLRERGHDVVHAAEQELAGRSDDEVFARNAADGRATLTNNAQDFVPLAGRAAADGLDHPGLLLTSDRSLPRSRNGIGLLVTVIDELVATNPGGDALRNRVRWLP